MGSEREQAVENMRDAIRGAFANSRHLHRMDPDVAQLVTEEIMGELFREDSRWVFGALASPPAAPPELAKVVAENDRLRVELEAVAAPLETLLVEVEPALAERRSALEAHCTAVQNWADAANAKAENGRIWCYLSEHRARLEREHEPLREAVGNANRALDALRAALAKGGQGGE